MHGKSMLWVVGAWGALTLALPARAPAQEAAAERLERIEITGSRLATSDVESASPIAIVTPEEIRQQGFPFLELFLNTLPQIVPEQGNRISNGASGTATLDLRGM